MKMKIIQVSQKKRTYLTMAVSGIQSCPDSFLGLPPTIIDPLTETQGKLTSESGYFLCG